jgi:hypothetical protein
MRDAQGAPGRAMRMNHAHESCAWPQKVAFQTGLASERRQFDLSARGRLRFEAARFRGAFVRMDLQADIDPSCCSAMLRNRSISGSAAPVGEP